MSLVSVLTSERVKQLARRWEWDDHSTDPGDQPLHGQQRWNQVRYLAEKAKRATLTAPVDSDDGHHLILAVANFKRTAGRVTISSWQPERTEPVRADSVLLAGIELREEDSATWEKLEEALDGFGVATTTTLLASLWPQTHGIIDRFSIAGALYVADDADGAGAPLGRRRIGFDKPSPEMLRLTWKDYLWYRRAIRSVDVPELVDVERALYVLGRWTAKVGRGHFHEDWKKQPWAEASRIARDNILRQLP